MLTVLQNNSSNSFSLSTKFHGQQSLMVLDLLYLLQKVRRNPVAIPAKVGELVKEGKGLKASLSFVGLEKELKSQWPEACYARLMSLAQVSEKDRFEAQLLELASDLG